MEWPDAPPGRRGSPKAPSWHSGEAPEVCFCHFAASDPYPAVAREHSKSLLAHVHFEGHLRARVHDSSKASPVDPHQKHARSRLMDECVVGHGLGKPFDEQNAGDNWMAGKVTGEKSLIRTKRAETGHVPLAELEDAVHHQEWLSMGKHGRHRGQF